MLIISGTAEFVGTSGKFTKGDQHEFTMFCANENLDEQLKEIEAFFNDRDWDEIVIQENGVIADETLLENDTLKQAYQKASTEKFSLIVKNISVSNV